MSGFLLGYVAMLPLIGRIADLRGRVPVLVAALVRLRDRLAGHRARLRPAHAGGRPVPPGRRRRRPGPGHAGAGRGPLPRRAPRRPARRRLGRPGARQRRSVRSTARVVLAVADWRVIFALNLVVGLVLAAADRAGSTGRASRRPTASARPRPVRLGRRWLLLAVALVAGALVFVEPTQPAARPHLGAAVHPGRRRRPLAHPGRPRSRSSPRCCWSSAAARPRRPLVDLRGWWRSDPRGRPRRRRCSWPSRSAA